MSAERNETDVSPVRNDLREEWLADLLRGIEQDPVSHIRRITFAMGLLELDTDTRLRACRAAVTLLTRAGVYTPDFMPTLLAYLSHAEIDRLKNELRNQKFFAEHVPDLATEMIQADLPAPLR